MVKGSKNSEEVNRKNSESQIKRFANMSIEESKHFSEVMSKVLEQRWANMSEEEKKRTAAKKSKSQKKRLASFSEEKRAKINRKMSEGAKRKYAKMTKEEIIELCANRPNFGANIKDWYASLTPEEVKIRNHNVSKGIRKWMSLLTEEEMYRHFRLQANPSSIEKMIWEELDKLGIEYEKQVPFVGNRFIVDIYIPSKGVIIECNGDWWHNYEVFPKKKIRDEALEKYADKIGLKVIWLWEHDIRKDPEQALRTGLRGVNFARI